MIGDERVRFCGQCSLNVYNLSSMIRADAEALIARTEGRLCVRFYRRRDGSIITKDCPVGLQAIRRRVSYLAKAIGSMVLGLFAGLGVHAVSSGSGINPFEPAVLMGSMVAPKSPPRVMMGELRVDRIQSIKLDKTKGARHRSSSVLRQGEMARRINKQSSPS
jgi:hypothetical protein